MVFYNVGFGGITSGIGAVINKKPGEHWSKNFVRGFWQGCIGGALNYSAKKTAGFISERKAYFYGIPARFLSGAGNSIIQNSAANEPFFVNWHFEYAFFRIDYYGQNEHPFRIRILPLAMVGSVVAFTKAKFDPVTTLLTGAMVFNSTDSIGTGRGSYDGINYGRVFIYQDGVIKYHLVTHELIHEYQLREYLVFNSFLRPVASRIKEKEFKKVFIKYIYPDIPYFGLAYAIEGVNPHPRYFRNYFEFEAEKIASGKDVRVE